MALDTRIGADVVIGIDAGAADQAIKQLTLRMRDVVKQILDMGTAFSESLGKPESKSDAAVKSLQKIQSALRTLEGSYNQLVKASGQDLFEPLNEQRIGKKLASLGQLKAGLEQSATATEALVKRQQLLLSKIAETGNAPGLFDVRKLENLKEAERQIRAFERSLAQLDRTRINGANPSASMIQIRDEIQKAQETLLSLAKNKSVIGFDGIFQQLDALKQLYKDIPNIEKQAADQAKRDVEQLIKLLDQKAKGEFRDAKTADDLERKRHKQIVENLLAEQEIAKKGFDKQLTEAEKEFKLLERERELRQKNLSLTEEELRKKVRTASSGFDFSRSDKIGGISSVDALRNYEQAFSRVLALQQQLATANADDAKQLGVLNRELLELIKNAGEAQAILAQVSRNERASTQPGAAAGGGLSSYSNFTRQLLSLKGLQEVMLRVGTYAFAGAGIFAAANAVQGTLGFVVEYEEKLKQLQAISGATDTELKNLAGSILEVGKNSKSSLLEITEAATTLAQAGYSASETGKVLKDALNLSAASGATPKEAVDLLTSALGAFNLTADASTHIVDVLVAGLNNTKLTTEQMALAIQYAGSTAFQAGVSFEELTALAGSLAQAGIRSGSTIGTGLRQVIIEFEQPTEKFRQALSEVGLTMADVDIKTKSLADIIKTLTSAGFGATQALEAFDKRGAAAYLALKGQIGSYDQLALSLAQDGAAAEAQAKSMDNLGAQWKRFINILSGFAEQAGQPVLVVLKDVLYVLSDALEVVGEVAEEFDKLTQSMLGVDLSGAALLTGIGALTGSAFGPLGIAIGAATGALIGLAGAFGDTNSSMDKLRAKSNESGERLDALTQKVTSVDDAIKNLINRQSSLQNNSTALRTEVLNLEGRFEGLTLKVGNTTNAYRDLINQMLRYRQSVIRDKELAAREDAALRQDLIDSTRDRASKLINGATGPQYSSGIVDRLRGLNVDTTNPEKLDSVIAELRQLRLQGNEYIKQNNLGRRGTSGYTIDNLLTPLIEVLTERQRALTKLQLDNDNVATSRALQTLEIRQYQSRILGFQTEVNSVLESEKRTRSTGQIQQTEGNISAFLAQVRKQADSTTDQVRKRVLESIVEQLNDLLSQLNRGVTDSFDQRIKGQTIDTYAIGKKLKQRFSSEGLEVSSAGVSKNHNKGSLHGIGRGLDITVRNPTPELLNEIVAYLESELGLELAPGRNGVNDEYDPKNRTPKTTGGHYHFGFQPKTTRYQRKADQLAARTQRQSDRLEDIAAAGAAKLERDRIENLIDRGGSRTDLDAAIADFRKAALDAYTKRFGRISGANQAAFVEGRKNLEDQISEQAEKWNRDLFDASFRAYLKGVDNTLKDIGNEQDARIFRANDVRDTARGNLDQAKSYRNRNQVDAGTLAYLERKSREADAFSASENVKVNQDTLAKLNQSLNEQAVVIATSTLNQNQYQEAASRIEKTEKQILDTKQKLIAAQREYDALTGETKVRSLGRALGEAAGEWVRNSGAAQEWSTILANNVGPLLDTLTNGFTDFFTAIAEGSKSFGDALGDMLLNFVRFVEQMLIRALALKAVKALLSLIPGVGSFFGFEDGGLVGEGYYNGGLVKPKGYAAGGLITEGFSTHDSVPAMLARNEFVMNNRAVADVGVDVMRDINRNGRKAFDRMGTVAVPKQKDVNQRVNVYVVPPEQKPTLTPNDVLLVVSDDLLQNGQTARLIKTVVQAG